MIVFRREGVSKVFVDPEFPGRDITTVCEAEYPEY